jgi:hypothetical protein
MWPIYPTDANNSDTDSDLLPDGLEIFYGTDPLNPDSDSDGVLDGYEFDADADGISDGEEFYVYETWRAPLVAERQSPWALVHPPGGFDNPDSDADGLTDGDEILIYGSDPTSNDTDGDGLSDGAEVAAGQNPIVPIITGFSSMQWLAIGGAAGFVAAVFIVKVLPWTWNKIRGDGKTKPKKKTTKKKTTTKKTKTKKKKTTESAKKKKTSSTKKEGSKK